MRALTATPLGRAALLLAGTDALHALDHARQARHLGAAVTAAGVAGWVALAVLLGLVARRHRLAAPYGAAVGLALATGIVAVHVLPHWSAFSDPYPDANVDALSWALVAIPVLAAVNLVVRAAQALRADRSLVAGAGRARPLG